MGLSRTVPEINGDFSRNHKFPPSPYINTLAEGKAIEYLKGFPLLLGIGVWAQSQKTRMMGLPGRDRSLTISLTVWIDAQTDIGRATRGNVNKPGCIAKVSLKMLPPCE